MAIINRKSKLTFYQEEIIKILLKHPQGIIKKQLAIKVYDYYDSYTVRCIDQHIHKLKIKVEKLGIGIIETRAYDGYRANGGKLIFYHPKEK